MPKSRIVVLAAMVVCVSALALAQEQVEIQNWTVSPYWTPPAAGQVRQHLTGTGASPEIIATPVPTTILPFTAVTPCRLYDNRANSPFTGDSTFNTDGQTELFDFLDPLAKPPYAAKANPNGCTMPTAGTVGAWSLKFTYRTSSAAQGYLTAYPGNITRPGIGTILGNSTQQTSGAAIVPAGSDADNTINVYAQYAADTLVIDYNGYFAAQPVVTGITDGIITTPLTGVVGFTGGTGITVDASSGTVTITGPGGPTGPEGPTGPLGPTGPQGDLGPTGPQGNVGATGPQGNVGATGPQGNVGATGPQGNLGPTGPQGLIGPQGATGPQGGQGIQGPTGPAGATGATGPAPFNIFGGVRGNGTITVTTYFPPFYSETQSATETSAEEPMVAGTLSNFRASVNVAPGSGNSWTFTVRVNGASPANGLTCTITGTTATTCTDDTHSVSLSAGDLVDIQATATSGPTGARIAWSMKLAPNP